MSLRSLRYLIQRTLRGDPRNDAVSELDQSAIAPYCLEANVSHALCWGVPLSALVVPSPHDKRERQGTSSPE
jgi:hypothetical protein